MAGLPQRSLLLPASLCLARQAAIGHLSTPLGRRVSSVLHHLQESLDPCPHPPAPAFTVLHVQLQDGDAALFHFLIEEQLVVAILSIVAEDLGDNPIDLVLLDHVKDVLESLAGGPDPAPGGRPEM